MRRPWGFVVAGILSLVFVSPPDVGAGTPLNSDGKTVAALGDPTGDSPKRRIYIRAHTAGEEQVVALRRTLILEGAEKVNLFVPSQIIVCDVPAGMDIASLIDDARFSVMDEPEVNIQLAAGRSDDLRFVKKCYERHSVSVPEGVGFPGPDGFGDVVRTIPPEVVEASKEAVRLSAVSGSVQERNIQQNAEFLAGDILLQLVFPESDGNGENWTEEALADAASGAFAAALDCQSKFGFADIHFVLKSDAEVPTTYEPILTTMSEHELWIFELMENLGVDVDKTADLMVHAFNNRWRRYYQTDWVFTAFVADSDNAPGHRFADQFYTAYANLGGPYLVIPYPAGDDPYEIGWWLVFSTVFQHEMMHIFWALDEYPAEINMTQCTTRSGYLAYPNMNKVTQMMDGTYASCPGQELQLCIMWRAKEDHDRPMCKFTRGQIGVVDDNENSTPDVFEAPPKVVFEIAAPETVETPDVEIRFKVISQAVPNRNPFQNPEDRAGYAPRLKDALVSVNGMGGIPWDAEDGRWDEKEEDVKVSLTGIPVGLTEIGVRARNVYGVDSEIFVKQIYFAGIKFTQFDLDHPPEGIRISWITVGETFGARLNLYRIDATTDVSNPEMLVADIQPFRHTGDLFHEYAYLDTLVVPGHTYRYFITGAFEIEYGGNLVAYRDTSAVFEADAMFTVPQGGLVSNASPNPFNESMRISVRVPQTVSVSSGDPGSSSYGVPVVQQTEVKLVVYDVAGRRVRDLFNGRMYGGMRMFVWDGSNEKGERLPSGVYFLKTIAGSATEVKKVVIVR